MSQLQLWVVIAAPSILALVGILLNQTGLHRLDGRIDRVEQRLGQRIDQMMDVWNRDVKDVLGMIADHGQRIVRIEEQQRRSGHILRRALQQALGRCDQGEAGPIEKEAVLDNSHSAVEGCGQRGRIVDQHS